MLQQSSSQTVGPFFSIGMTYGELNQMVQDDTVGQRIYLRGRVFDGDGQGVNDAIVEIWQADANGIYNHPLDRQQADADGAFFGHGRAATDAVGNYWFKTIKPGSVDGMSPHLAVRVLMRGLLLHVVTRFYFSDEDNSADPILSAVSAERRHTLIAQRDDSEGTPIYRLDIHMQGDLETVFFEP
ncbi:MAG: protocatechuate 3,4-dioxygenase subunit alpha [Candidatus Promineifilaceae bacterium]